MALWKRKDTQFNGLLGSFKDWLAPANAGVGDGNGRFVNLLSNTCGDSLQIAIASDVTLIIMHLLT